MEARTKGHPGNMISKKTINDFDDRSFAHFEGLKAFPKWGMYWPDPTHLPQKHWVILCHSSYWIGALELRHQVAAVFRQRPRHPELFVKNGSGMIDM
jgi:hypothetical protein